MYRSWHVGLGVHNTRITREDEVAEARAVRDVGGMWMEMNRRRSNVEVIADILRLGDAGKTEIMYSANMSYRQL